MNRTHETDRYPAESRQGMAYSPSVTFIRGDVRTQGAYYRPEDGGGSDWLIVSASNPLLRAFVTQETIGSITAGNLVTIDITPAGCN